MLGFYRRPVYYGDHFEREAVAGMLTIRYREELAGKLRRFDDTLDHVRRAITAEAGKRDPDRSFLGYLYERVDDLQGRRDGLTLSVHVASVGFCFTSVDQELLELLRKICDVFRSMTRELLDLIRSRLPGFLSPRKKPGASRSPNHPSRLTPYLTDGLRAWQRHNELAARAVRDARGEGRLRRRL